MTNINNKRLMLEDVKYGARQETIFKNIPKFLKSIKCILNPKFYKKLKYTIF